MNQIIFWLSAAAFIVVAIMRVTDPILPILADEFGLTVGKASIVVTAFTVPYALVQLLVGPLGDRFGKLKIVVYALAASSIFTLMCALADSVELLAGFRFLAGMATAAVVPLSMAFIADNFSYEVRQPVIARYLSGLIMGQIAGGSLGGIMAELFGWRVIFIVFGIVVGAMTYFVWRFSKHHEERVRPVALYGRQLFVPYVALMRQRRPRIVIVTAIVEGFFFFGASAFLGAFLHERFEIGYAWVGLMLACFGIGSLIYSRTAGPIIKILGERRMVIAGSLTMSCCYLALAFAPSWQICVPVLMICGFGFYLMHNTLQTLATELAPEARGTAVSLFAFSLIIGQGAGVAFLGSIIDRPSYTPAFVLVSIAIVCLGMWFQDKLKATPSTAVVP
jgi:predicted MFS family arabinose efflux permease